MAELNGGNVIHSLNTFRDEFYNAYPFVRCRTYRAYAKLTSNLQTTFPLYVPSKQKGTDDAPLTFKSLTEHIYSITTVATVPIVATTGEKLKLGTAVATGSVVSIDAASSKFDAGVLYSQTTTPGVTLNAPLGNLSTLGIALTPVSLFVANAAGSAVSTTGIKLESAPATKIQQDLYKKYKDRAYIVLDIKTFQPYSQAVADTTSLDSFGLVIDPLLTATFSGL